MVTTASGFTSVNVICPNEIDAQRSAAKEIINLFIVFLFLLLRLKDTIFLFCVLKNLKFFFVILQDLGTKQII